MSFSNGCSRCLVPELKLMQRIKSFLTVSLPLWPEWPLKFRLTEPRRSLAGRLVDSRRMVLDSVPIVSAPKFTLERTLAPPHYHQRSTRLQQQPRARNSTPAPRFTHKPLGASITWRLGLKRKSRFSTSSLTHKHTHTRATIGH